MANRNEFSLDSTTVLQCQPRVGYVALIDTNTQAEIIINPKTHQECVDAAIGLRVASRMFNDMAHKWPSEGK